MNDSNIIDDLKSTGEQWSTELTGALHAAGFTTHWEKHSNKFTLGYLIASKPGYPETTYKIAFQRKLVVKPLKGKEREAALKADKSVMTRRLITQLDLYNPVGGLHVHVRKYSMDMVLKIISYADQSINRKLASDAHRKAVDNRVDKANKLYAEQMKGFVMPDWVRTRPNVESDADLGTFRLLFSDNRVDWPLAKLTPAKVRQVVDAIRAIVCDHKFVDSKCCLKCGWTPPAAYDKAADDKQWMDLTQKG